MEAVVAYPIGVRILIWTGFPLLGAAAGWLLKLIVSWGVNLEWGPLRGPAKLVGSFHEPTATLVGVGLGLGVGLFIAYLSIREALTVTVTGDRVTLTRGDGTAREYARDAITGVFLDGKRLVLLGQAGEELAREECDLEAGRLAAAFRENDYPWRPDGDPFRDGYRRWVEGTPDLPAAADVLLRARDRALAKGDRLDLAEFRAELARLGVVVRDEKKRQYWRLVTGVPEDSAGFTP